MFTLYNVFIIILKILYNQTVYLSSIILLYNVNIIYCEDYIMKLRVIDILNEKGKTRYWLYIQLGMSYQNFNKMIYNETKSIKYDNLQALCEILECTPNDLFEEYHSK